MFYFSAHEKAEMLRKEGIQQEAEALLLEVYHSENVKEVPMASLEVMEAANRFAQDSVFAKSEELQKLVFDRDLLKKWLSYPHLTGRILDKSFEIATSEESTFEVFLQHPNLEEETILFSFWVASRDCRVIPKNIGENIASHAARALFPASRLIDYKKETLKLTNKGRDFIDVVRVLLLERNTEYYFLREEGVLQEVFLAAEFILKTA